MDDNTRTYWDSSIPTGLLCEHCDAEEAHIMGKTLEELVSGGAGQQPKKRKNILEARGEISKRGLSPQSCRMTQQNMTNVMTNLKLVDRGPLLWVGCPI